MVSEGAFCTNTNSEFEREISKHEWDSIRFGRISLSAEDYAKIEATIQKLCYETRACTLEVKKTMRKIDRVRARVDR